LFIYFSGQFFEDLCSSSSILLDEEIATLLLKCLLALTVEAPLSKAIKASSDWAWNLIRRLLHFHHFQTMKHSQRCVMNERNKVLQHCILILKHVLFMVYKAYAYYAK